MVVSVGGLEGHLGVVTPTDTPLASNLGHRHGCKCRKAERPSWSRDRQPTPHQRPAWVTVIAANCKRTWMPFWSRDTQLMPLHYLAWETGIASNGKRTWRPSWGRDPRLMLPQHLAWVDLEKVTWTKRPEQNNPKPDLNRNEKELNRFRPEIRH